MTNILVHLFPLINTPCETSMMIRNFDDWGSEFYRQYRVTDNLWSIGGYNILKPDSDQE